MTLRTAWNRTHSLALWLWAHREQSKTVPFLIVALFFAFIPIFWMEQWGALRDAWKTDGLFVLYLLILSIGSRTIPLHLVLAAFLAGGGIVMLTTLLVQTVVLGVLSVQWSSARVVLAGYSEEILKIAPLCLILWRGPWRHLRYTATPVDFALLGAAVGFGFGYVEDLFRGLSHFEVVGPHLGSVPLLPNLLRVDRGITWSAILQFGHSGWAALTALGLGYASRLSLKHPRWWLVGLGSLGLAIFEHNSYNRDLASPSRLVAWLQYLDLLGTVGSIVFIGGFGWALYRNHQVLKRFRTLPDDVGRPVPSPRASALFSIGGVFSWVRWESLVRVRRAHAFALAALSGCASKHQREALGLAARLGIGASERAKPGL